MKRFLTIGGIGGVALGLVIAAIFGGLAITERLSGSGGPGDPGQLVPVKVKEHIPGPPGPEPLVLTEEDVARSKEVFANDPIAKALLVGRPYAIKSVILWQTGTNQKIGTRMEIDLLGPIVIKGDWPTIHYDEAEQSTPPYQDLTYKATVRTRELEANVDLARGKVVSIGPGEDSPEVIEYEPPQGFTHIPHPD